MKHLDKTIYLTGFMGTGKTSISRVLGEMTGAQVVDTDQKIVLQKKMSIPEIFEKYGEKYFRELETRCLKKIELMDPLIVSCGGGITLSEENRQIMKRSGVTIWLDASPQTVYDRVKNGKDRPVLNGRMSVEGIRTLMEERKPRYESAMNYKVMTDDRSLEEIAKEILSYASGISI